MDRDVRLPVARAILAAAVIVGRAHVVPLDPLRQGSQQLSRC